MQQQNQQFNRFGNIPKPARIRSRTPSKRIGAPSVKTLAAQQAEQLSRLEQPTNLHEPAGSDHPQVSQQAQQSTAQVSQPTILEATGQQQVPEQPASAPHSADQPHESAQATQAASAEVIDLDPPSQPTTAQLALDDPYQEVEPTDAEMPQQQLPQKRSFEQMFTLKLNEDIQCELPPAHWDASPDIGFGPRPSYFHQIYLGTEQRQEDVKGLGKEPTESDTAQDSDSDDDSNFTTTPQQPPHQQPTHNHHPTTSHRQHAAHSLPTSTNTKTTSSTPLYKQGMTRQQVKALDREIPWRRIVEMPGSYVDKFLAAVYKEAESWASWNSVEPLLTDAQAAAVYRDPLLSQRILRSRAVYRDKALGVGEVRAKCRVVALGHRDPDLEVLRRTSSTPGRIAEHVVFAMIVAGYNGELLDSSLQWTAWTGDASTAFLQGEQEQRPLPLFLKPPSDGLISQTSTWSAQLYRIRGNIYGLANAPCTWSVEVARRLSSIGYLRHSFDQQLYYKVVNGSIQSIILVYVDDFVGISRSDYNLAEVHELFKWGALTEMAVNSPLTFKGKELTLLENNGRYTMKITMKSFIDNMEQVTLPRGRLQQDEQLTETEKKELRRFQVQFNGLPLRPDLRSLQW